MGPVLPPDMRKREWLTGAFGCALRKARRLRPDRLGRRHARESTY